MLAKVKMLIDKYQLFSMGNTVVVAFSGGADSLTLLHMLLAMKDDYQINVIAAHVNHMFRGGESDSDEEFVKKHCSECGIICYAKAIDVPAYIIKTGMSPEDAARKLRYRYLQSVAALYGKNTKIATGHHRDDQAETVFLNLMRGAGSAGLRGMQPVNKNIIRPLLSLTRQEIEQFCHENNFAPRVDSTNFSCDYLRNRLRLKIMPQLEENFSKGIKDALCRTAALVGDEHDFILAEVNKLWPQIITEKNGELHIAIELLKNIHIALLREFVRQVIDKQRGNLKGISFMHVEKLIEFSFKGSVGKVLQLPGGLVAVKGYQDVTIGLPKAAPIVGIINKELTVTGSTEIPELRLSIHIYKPECCVLASNCTAVFDYHQLALPLSIRTRKAGDKFWPKGMSFSKKLKDFFIDLKVPRQQRDQVPLVCDSRNNILWVAGYRQSELCRPREETTDFLQITLNKWEDFQ